MHHSKTLYGKGIIRNRKMVTQSPYSNFKFVARLDHIKNFYAGLKALHFGGNGYFQVNEDGFRVTVEQGKSIQASLFITPACFAEYYTDGLVTFGLNMDVITECLGIFSGTDCSMKMFYKGGDSPLLIILEPQADEDVTTECAIKTINQDEPVDFNLDEDSPSLNIIFIRGPDLMNIFNELDRSAEELAITLGPRAPHFKLDSLGVTQSETSFEVPKTSDIFLLFNCRDRTSAKYINSQLRCTMKALSISSKVAVKTDASGLLELHFMLQSEEEAEVYVQFFIMPIVEETES